jgi:hypothetical protein
MAKAKFYTRDQILDAMSKTKSIRAAARYLNCSYQHLKPFMKQYTHPETGETLFDTHKNQHGKGIPKFSTHNGKFKSNDPHILDIVEGRVSAVHFSPEKLKHRMIEANLMEEKCHSCGYQERRITDYKMPLILHFKDGDTRHYNLGNVQLLCYNCYFIYYGQVFTEKEIEKFEGHGSITMKMEEEKMMLDDYQIKMLEQLGLKEKDNSDDPYSLVSYK